jgi:hypothetical protein
MKTPKLDFDEAWRCNSSGQYWTSSRAQSLLNGPNALLPAASDPVNCNAVLYLDGPRIDEKLDSVGIVTTQDQLELTCPIIEGCIPEIVNLVAGTGTRNLQSVSVDSPVHGEVCAVYDADKMTINQAIGYLRDNYT